MMIKQNRKAQRMRLHTMKRLDHRKTVSSRPLNSRYLLSRKNCRRPGANNVDHKNHALGDPISLQQSRCRSLRCHTTTLRQIPEIQFEINQAKVTAAAQYWSHGFTTL